MLGARLHLWNPRPSPARTACRRLTALLACAVLGLTAGGARAAAAQRPDAEAFAAPPAPDGAAGLSLPAEAPVARPAAGLPAVATDAPGAKAAVAAEAAAPAPVAAAGLAPSLWGLQDFGGYLVVVDGVPWGGAFTPAVSRVNLADVERIDVQGGAVPVLYGTASFAGVARVTRYAPADSPGVAHASVGSYGSAAAGASGALPGWRGVGQSLSVDVSRDNGRAPDQGISDARAVYRAATTLAGGRLRLDLESETETRLPESPVSRVGSLLADTPLDANYQPVDARVGAHRTQANLGYTHDSALGPIEALASYALARVADRRGFLDAPPSDLGINGANATGFDQDRRLRALYADLHARTTLAPTLALGWGGDWQGGAATQTSNDFHYYVSLDGTRRRADGAPGQTGFSDHRSFAGAYAELDWAVTDRLAATLTGRLAHNTERRETVAGPGFTGAAPVAANAYQSTTRLNLGVALTWQAGAAAATGGVLARLSYRNSSQPAAPDFGPDYRPGVLAPMSGRRAEAGLKGVALGERLAWDLSASYTDIGNLVVAQADPQGNPVLANAGTAHVRALDLGTRWQPLAARSLTLHAGAGAHVARFGSTRSIENGVPTDLVGHDFALAPHAVASGSIGYEPPNGAYATAGASYEGRRYLDRQNTATVGGYTTLEARAGYRAGRGGVVLRATNLSNRRDVQSESEFGDQAFYRTPARAVSLEVYVAWR